MIKVEAIDVWGFEHAIRGMRNPMNSWHRSDSNFDLNGVHFSVGETDLNLMRKLYKGGPEHRKYLRQIFVSMDITAPLYWWKEYDTYKVGTVANSCSTMHKIAAKEFELDDFSHEHLLNTGINLLEHTIELLNKWRAVYITGNQVFSKNDKAIWWQMIQSLPSSYNQKRTVTFNYENAVSMIHQRTNHKLDEWNEFVKVLEKLPYLHEIMGE